jgi:hypothetical protein
VVRRTRLDAADALFAFAAPPNSLTAPQRFTYYNTMMQDIKRLREEVSTCTLKHINSEWKFFLGGLVRFVPGITLRWRSPLCDRLASLRVARGGVLFAPYLTSAFLACSLQLTCMFGVLYELVACGRQLASPFRWSHGRRGPSLCV